MANWFEKIKKSFLKDSKEVEKPLKNENLQSNKAQVAIKEKQNEEVERLPILEASQKEELIQVPVIKEPQKEIIQTPVIEEVKEEIIQTTVIEEVKEEIVQAPVIEEVKEEIIQIPVIEEVKEEIIQTTVIEEVKEEIIQTPVIEELKEEIIQTTVIEEVKEEIIQIPVIEEVKEEIIQTPVIEEVKEEIIQTSVKEEKKSWFNKVVDTLNAPIEIKIEPADSDAGFLSKIKIGLGKPVVKETEEEREAWKERLKDKLSLTRQGFVEKIERIVKGKTKIDNNLLEEIEDILIESDVGVEMTEKICDNLRQMAKEKRFLPSEVMPSLFDYLRNQLHEEEHRIIVDEERLNIILMVGVNGTGKTTTTGKIAAKLKISDYSVVLAAADTFRAAAIEQLEIWAKRANVPIIKHVEGSDAAAVVYDGIKSAQAKKANVLVIDTAGRLHNKVNLMEELKKIRRIIDKEAPTAKLEVLLVLDATTGQNGLKQAEVFGKAVSLTGVVLTKLDGTARGGVIFSIKNTLGIPIKLVGVGEGIEDLRDFSSELFVEALFSGSKENIEKSTKISEDEDE